MMDDINMGTVPAVPSVPAAGTEASSAPTSSTCTNCGMVMNNPEDHAGGDLNSALCVDCASQTGEGAAPETPVAGA